MPLVLVNGTSGVSAASLTTFFSAIPLRTLPVVLLGTAVVAAAAQRHWRFAILLGVGCALASVNNIEFGLTASIAAAMAFAAAQARYGLRHMAAVVAAGCGGALFTVELLVILSGDSVGALAANWTAFARSFSAGMMAMPMPLLGPHFFVLMVLVGGVCMGFVALLADALGARSANPVAMDPDGRRRALLMAFFGLSGLASFGYYAGRSNASGQLQIFLVFVAPVAVAVCGYAIQHARRPVLGPDWALTAGLVLLPTAVAIAAVLQAPSPLGEWNRVIGTGRPDLLRAELDDRTDAIAQTIAALPQNVDRGQLGLAGEYANYVGLRLGIPAVSALADPANAWLAASLREPQCRALSGTAVTWVLAASWWDPKTNEAMCPGWVALGDYPVDGKPYTLLLSQR